MLLFSLSHSLASVGRSHAHDSEIAICTRLASLLALFHVVVNNAETHNCYEIHKKKPKQENVEQLFCAVSLSSVEHARISVFLVAFAPLK